MRTKVITESTSTPLELVPEEVEALRHLGKSLASKTKRHGVDEEEEAPERTIIRCTRTDKEGVYDVRVSEAVGVIRVLDRVQIEVQPKIPLSHLIHLMTAAIRPGGLLICSFELLAENAELYRLEPHGRYCHSESYVTATFVEAGLVVNLLHHENLRKERGLPVDGLLILLHKPSFGTGVIQPISIEPSSR